VDITFTSREGVRPMKRIVLMLFALLMFPVAAYAGVMEVVTGTIGGWIIENALAAFISSIFAVIAAFWGGSSWGKIAIRAKVPVTELKDVAVKVHRARLASSPGGSKITDDEKNDSLKEVEEVIAAAITAFGGQKTTD